MLLKKGQLTAAFLLLALFSLRAQEADSSSTLLGVVYNRQFAPIDGAHVVNLRTHQGVITDAQGFFELAVMLTDTLFFAHLHTGDTLVHIRDISSTGIIILNTKYYALEAARVFPWGSSYEDFKEAVLTMPDQVSLAESLGLPQQNPDKVPQEMDEKQIKSAGLLLSSPVSFFYYNYSKYAKSARRRYWLEKNHVQEEAFQETLSLANLAHFTGVTGERLNDFRGWLMANMKCTASCDELTLLDEIHGLWRRYQDLEAAGILDQ